MFTGAITGAITTPLDVMKTRLMVEVESFVVLNLLDVITLSKFSSSSVLCCRAQQANTMGCLIVLRLLSEKKVQLLS